MPPKTCMVKTRALGIEYLVRTCCGKGLPLAVNHLIIIIIDLSSGYYS